MSAAVSQSPSSLTISGALEPSSRLTFLCGALERMPQPTGADPVKVIAPMRSSSTMALPTSDPGPADDLQPVLRQARVVEDLGQLDRGDRRLAGGLQHDRVAGGDRGPELVGDEVEREVEGADRADDAVGDADHDAELALARRAGLHRDRVRRSGCGPRRRRTAGSRRSAGPRRGRSSPACPPRRRSSSSGRPRARRTSSAARSSMAARSYAGNPPASKAARAASTALPTSAASPFGTRPIRVPS